MIQEIAEDRPRQYWCVTGHELPAAELEHLTEEVSLDRGALVRICREHGAPIGTSVAPAAGE